MMQNNFLVIMAGGVGSRFWPMSRTSNPKQFIDVLGVGKTLIQQTYDRFLAVCPKENIFIVTNDIYKDIVLQQLPDLQENQVLCEPSRRNTAPCVAYASYKIKTINPQANIIVAPSDHIILDTPAFVETIQVGLEMAKQNDCLITLGIKPSRPDTGYGYIQYNDTETLQNSRAKKVITFTEKPNLELAQKFVASGDFLWNSGIFIWSLSSILQAFQQHLPEINQVFKEGDPVYNTSMEASFINQVYATCRSISIDYGVMEKSQNVYTIPSDFGWSDLGTWGSLYDIRTKDEQGNSIVGAHVMTYNTENCIVHVSDDKLVVLDGMKDCIIVEANNVFMVCPLKNEQQIRQIVTDVTLEKGNQYI